jgi:uncharacterized protein YeaO (DUF488 family)
MSINIKRAYEPAASADGYRVLVDRLWPRGVRKEAAHIDRWAKELSPTTELREWFGHDPDKWREFQKRYRAELRRAEAQAALEDVAGRAAHGRVTLVYGTKDSEHSNAMVLRELIERRLVRAAS